MIIEKNRVVSFDYTLKDAEGTVLDSSEGSDALEYLHGAGNIIPGLEAALDGKEAGDCVAVVVEPAQGYGERDDALIGTIPRKDLEGIDDIQIGMQLEAHSPEGLRVMQVVGMDDDNVSVDANHPLAGMTLYFDLSVAAVREATAEEVEHGHAHGCCGHDH